MANNTIYPYGQNGELPSSIGLVNDLTTGGADKALTAEQGKVLGQYIYGGDLSWESVDLSNYAVKKHSLGANTTSNKKWTQKGEHQVIPVNPGQSVRIQILASTNPSQGAFYGFFTSSYVQPTSTSSDVPYATGSSRSLIQMSQGEMEIVAPSDAAYLCICPKDGNEYVSTWSVKLSTVNGSHIRFNTDEVLGDTKIINDTSTGGEHDVLAAEQGKVLGEEVSKKQNKITEHVVIDEIPWVQRVHGSQTANILTVVDANEYSCKLTVKNQQGGSRFAMKVDGLEIDVTYNYEFYLYKVVNGQNVPVSTLSGGGAYENIGDSSASSDSISVTRTYDTEDEGRYYGTIKRNSSSGNYWSFALASQTSWLSIDDVLLVKFSRVYRVDEFQNLKFDGEPTEGSKNLVHSGGVFDFVKANSVESYREINLTDLYHTIPNRYINDSGQWKNSTNTIACFVKLKQNHRYKIYFPIGSQPVSFLKSVPSSTPSDGTTVTEWATGESSRHSYPIGETFITTPNDDDIYMVYNASYNDRRVTWSLFDANPDVFEDGLTEKQERRYEYKGESIDLSDKPKKFNAVYNISFKTTNHQSSALFNGHLFVVMNGSNNMTVYDYLIRNGVNPNTDNINAPLGGSYATVPNIGNATLSHCNSCAFSNSYYDSSDDFPIFYIAIRNNQGERVQWAGYRVVDPVYADNGSLSSFSLTNVHNIFLPAETEENGLGYTNVVFDEDKGEFWGYGRYNASGSDWTGKMTFTRFGKITYNGTTDVYLSDSDIKEQFRYKDLSMANAQGGCIKNNWLIFGQGYNSVGYIYCNIVNLRTHEFTRLDLKSLGFTYEPEGAFVLNNAICLTTSTGYEYIITL